MRVVIADDSGLLREGLSRLLTEAGVEVVASVGDATALEAAVAAHAPDAAIVDIRMPPTFTHEGALAATATPDSVRSLVRPSRRRPESSAITTRMAAPR